MKTKLLFFCLLFLYGVSLLTYSQTIDTLSNGKIIYNINGKFFDITNHDTIQVCPRSLMIIFRQNTELYDIQEFESANGLSNRFEFGVDSIIYPSIDPNYFLSIVSHSLSNSIVSDIRFSGYLKPLYNPPYPTDYYYHLDYYWDNNYNTKAQWYLYRLKVDLAWGITKGNKNVKIGLLDSGVDWDNLTEFGPTPDINEIKHRGYNYLRNSFDTRPDPSYPVQMKSHGTMLANIISARTNNGNYPSFEPDGGCAGIAGGDQADTLNLWTYLIYDETGHVVSHWVIQAINDALSKGVRLFNLSFGYPPKLNGSFLDCNTLCQMNDLLCITLKKAYAEFGAIFFSGTGNLGTESGGYIFWPACMSPYVMAVGGTNLEDKIFDHGPQNGNYGPDTFISAPGEATMDPILGTSTNYNFNKNCCETSGATAMATGVAGLMLAINPCLNSKEINEILKHTADKAGGYNYDENGHSVELGYGIIDAFEAVKAAGFPGALGGPELTTITSNNNNTPENTYTSLRCFTESITIEQDAILTIKSTVKMFPGTKIIVKPGAVLNIDGGKITSQCSDAFWDGIQVMSEVPDNTVGRVILNGATIEKALCGLLVCNQIEGQIYNLQNGQGQGIITATNTNFINCVTSVNFGITSPLIEVSPSFVGCKFEVNDDSCFAQNQVDPVAFVILNNVRGESQFVKCDFLNNSSNPYYLDGITSFFSSLKVEGEVSPDFTPCKFEKLHDAIRVVGNNSRYPYCTFTNSMFNLNVHGIYLSNANYSRILSNTFKVVENIGSYGLYVQNSTGYIIQDNEFFGSTPGNGLGLYIRDSGGDVNKVYNNRFTDLYCGSTADGENRSEDEGRTGLFFRCNDYSNCLYDISITKDPRLPYSPMHGIARLQGHNLPIDWAPAGNTFTKITNRYNIYNVCNTITYTHHRYYENAQDKVRPDPVTPKSVGLINDVDVVYSKLQSCPGCEPDCDENNRDYLKIKLAQYRDSTNIVNAQLSQVIDEGSTETINNNILFAVPDSAINLYNNLIAVSPFLSDTVIKSSIENEYVLINQMLHDILVANPQSAKSNSIMSKLDERIIPMPDDLRDDILNGMDTVAAKEIMDMQIAKYNELRESSLNTLIRKYGQDTTITNGLDSIISLLNNESGLESKYKLSLLYLQNGQSNLAENTMNAIPPQFNLTQSEQQTHQDYSILIDILEESPDPWSFQNLDSLSINTLQELATRDNCIPGAISRDILISKGVLAYEEPIILPDETKSGNRDRFNRTKHKQQSGTGCSLQISPNPAKSFVVISYEIKDKNGPYKLLIFDMKGNKINDINLSRAKESFILELNNRYKDVCFFTIICNNKRILTKQLIISK